MKSVKLFILSIFFISCICLKIQAQAPGSPILVEPPKEQTAVSLTPTFIWEAVSGAEYYDIFAYPDDEDNNPIIHSTTSGTEFYDPTIEFDPTALYRWKVRAGSTVYGWGNWSEVWSFTTTGSDNPYITRNTIPKVFALYQNYPNPFNPVTYISFDLPKATFVRIIVYDLLGRESETIVNQYMGAGRYKADWDATNFASGFYFYTIEAGLFKDRKKMILLK